MYQGPLPQSTPSQLSATEHDIWTNATPTVIDYNRLIARGHVLRSRMFRHAFGLLWRRLFGRSGVDPAAGVAPTANR